MSTTNIQEIDSKFFTIYLSYCWHDQNLAKLVASDISGFGYNILFDEDDDDKLNLEPFNSIYKCDLILVCLSSNYLRCFACQQEAKYFFEKKIPFLTVSIEEDFVADKNIAKILAGRQYKRLVKPIRYPDSKLELCKKISQIYRNMQYEDIIKQRIENRMPSSEEIEKRRRLYEEKLLCLMENEKKKVNQEKEKIEKLFVNDDLINGLKNEVPIIYRWYMKYPNVTISNLVPFTKTGDINDAPFSLPSDYVELLDSNASYKYSNGSIGRGCSPSHLNTQRTVNLCWLSIEYEKILAKKKTNLTDNEHEYYAKLIERNWKLNTSLGKNNIWRSFVGFPGPDRTEEEIKKRKKLDTNLSIKKQRRLKLSEYFNVRYKDCPSDTFCKFAQRMLDNKQEFEAFCEKSISPITLPNF